MGIEAGPSYTTDEGFELTSIYLTIECFRLLRSLDGSIFASAFTVAAYRSREDKNAGRRPINLPLHLKSIEIGIHPNDFFNQTLYGIAYDAVKAVWSSYGFTITDVIEPGQPTPTTFIYDSEGYNYKGFNKDGWDREGYDPSGFNAQDINRDGYNREGYNAEGYDAMGYDRNGYDRNGYNRMGYDRNGFNASGFNQLGYDREGYDANGYNAQGLDRNGNPREDISGNTL